MEECQIIRIKSWKVEQAIEMFNSLNSDGMPLNDSDIIYSKMYAVAAAISKEDEKTLGEIFYFFEFACGLSALILGVNPFNQPGVEAYKSNIKELLK